MSDVIELLPREAATSRRTALMQAVELLKSSEDEGLDFDKTVEIVSDLTDEFYELLIAPFEFDGGTKPSSSKQSSGSSGRSRGRRSKGRSRGKRGRSSGSDIIYKPEKNPAYEATDEPCPDCVEMGRDGVIYEVTQDQLDEGWRGPLAVCELRHQRKIDGEYITVGECEYIEWGYDD